MEEIKTQILNILRDNTIIANLYTQYVGKITELFELKRNY